MTDLPPEVELLALGAVVKEIAARETVLKALIGQGYADGDKHTFRSPLTGQKLGQVWRTDPNPKMVIVDRKLLEEHLMGFPGNVITDVVIADPDMPEALVVLQEHAPQLLTEVQRLDPTAVDAALAQSRETGIPAAPGIEQVKPSGVLTPKPDPAAYEQARLLVQAGALTWDFRPAIEEAS